MHGGKQVFPFDILARHWDTGTHDVHAYALEQFGTISGLERTKTNKPGTLT